MDNHRLLITEHRVRSYTDFPSYELQPTELTEYIRKVINITLAIDRNLIRQSSKTCLFRYNQWQINLKNPLLYSVQRYD